MALAVRRKPARLPYGYSPRCPLMALGALIIFEGYRDRLQGSNQPGNWYRSDTSTTRAHLDYSAVLGLGYRSPADALGVPARIGYWGLVTLASRARGAI